MKIAMHFYTHSFRADLNQISVSNGCSEFWRHSPKTNSVFNVAFQHHIWSNTTKSIHWGEFNLGLNFSIFVSMRTYEPFWESIMETGFVCSEYILTIARPTHASRAHAIQHFAHTNDLNLAPYYYSFKEAAISSPIWTMFLSFLFRKHTDSVIIHESNTVLLCTRCIIQKSFLEDDKALRWTQLWKVVWSETKHAEPRRSLAPLRDATPNSALQHPRYILSIT